MKIISRVLFLASIIGVALAGEWNCTSATPETTGTFNCTSDCTMTSAGAQLSGDLSIAGRAELTTITAKTSGSRRHFHVPSGQSHTLTLKWLKLRGGSMSIGGSIYVAGTGSTLHATSCVFFNNHATGYDGGGALFGGGSSIQLYHTNVTDNSAAGSGGGMSTNKGSIHIEDSIIARNTAVYKGGGTWQWQGTLDIYRSEIRENTQTSQTGGLNGGGGVYLQYSAVVIIRDSIFHQNHAAFNNGHQIYATKMMAGVNGWVGGYPSVTVVNTGFVQCTACGTGSNFYLYDHDDSSNSGAAAYGSLSRKACSHANPCTIHPFTGACTDRTDHPNYGMLCNYATTPSCSAGMADDVRAYAFPPSAAGASCRACWAGRWRANGGPSTCTSCDAGKYLTDAGTTAALHDGADDCLVCSKGTWSNAAAGVCTDCVAGTYLADPGTAASLHDAIGKCLVCPVNGISSGLGSGSCTIVCPAGRWSDTSVSGLCTDCAVGKYISDAGTAANFHDSIQDCMACPAGKWTVHTGAASCSFIEWNCAASSPQTVGAFNATSDCTMTSSGGTLSGDLAITGRPTLTTITAKVPLLPQTQQECQNQPGGSWHHCHNFQAPQTQSDCHNVYGSWNGHMCDNWESFRFFDQHSCEDVCSTCGGTWNTSSYLCSYDNTYWRDRRHFTFGSGYTLTLKWLRLTGGSFSNSNAGSIYVSGSSSTLRATYCAFFDNYAYNGGAMYGGAGSSIQLYHTNVTDNTAAVSGGGLYSVEGSLHIEDNIIARNTAGGQGGGIHQFKGTLDIHRSEIRENKQTAQTTTGDGGGGMLIRGDAVAAVRESVFEENHADGSDNGHQVFAYKTSAYGGAPSMTVVNTKFVPCSTCGTGTNFYLYDHDNTGNSGVAAYGTNSRKLCSTNPCTVAPFTGSCTARTDNADHGVTCVYSCGVGTYGTVSENSLPPAPACTTWSTCTAGEYVSSNGTNATDRVCMHCSTETFSASTNENSCTPWTNCSAGYHIFTNGTSSTARVCEPCGTGKYSTSANTFSCTAWTTCIAGQKIAANGTASIDRTCEACPSGRFATATNQNTCSNWTTCDAATEIESSVGSATTDRVCALAGSPSPSPAGSSPSPAGSSPSPAGSSPSPAESSSTTAAPNRLSAANRHQADLSVMVCLIMWFCL